MTEDTGRVVSLTPQRALGAAETFDRFQPSCTCGEQHVWAERYRLMKLTELLAETSLMRLFTEATKERP